MAQRYDTYKDSGVQWLGEIPGHWRCVPLKYFIDTKSGSAINVKDLDENGLYPVYGGGAQIGLCNKYNCNESEIIVGRVGAKCGCVNFPMKKVWATDNALIVTSKLNLKFTAIVLEAADLNRLNVANAQPLITGTKIKQVRIALPPLSEQHSIVSYLDDKCGKIDKMLEGKQKQIELLAEMKQRIIADAVTHGLNPDVKMKATNIPWLPEIPEHWSCIKLKAFCKDNKEKNKRNIESCVLSLSYGNVIVKQNVNFGLVPDNYESYQIVKPGYIILRLTDLQNDHKSLRTGLVKNRGIITSAYVGLVVNNINYEYVYLLLHSYDVMKVFYGMGGGLRQSMSYQDISNLYIPVPPLSEQRSIVSYITDKTAKIDTLTGKLQQEIESIKEYKQRLISDVVTGQIKVC